MTLHRKSPLKRTAMRASKTLPVQDPVLEGSMRQAPKIAQGARIPAKRKSAKTAALRAYERGFDALKPIIRERSHGVCEFFIDGICAGIATEFHHRKLRGQGGRNDEATVYHVCARCHSWTHCNVAQALDHGYLVHQWDDPAAIPVRRVEAA